MSPSSRKRPRKPRPTRKSRKPANDRAITFPQARGRMVEAIKLFADYRCVLIHFQDNTDLEIMIDPGLTFRAALYSWKSGTQRVLKRWPAI